MGNGASNQAPPRAAAINTQAAHQHPQQRRSDEVGTVQVTIGTPRGKQLDSEVNKSWNLSILRQTLSHLIFAFTIPLHGSIPQ